MYIEIIIVFIIFMFLALYRISEGENIYKFVSRSVLDVYNKYAPYSYKEMRSKIKKLGIDYTPRQYLTQIVLIGGLIGIICMRGVAEVIMRLMTKVPELEPMAYILIFVIAVKLFLSIPAIDIEIPSSAFGIFVLAVFIITIIVHFVRRKKQPQVTDQKEQKH